MENTNPFDWVAFYEELARLLLPYRENRPELIAKVRSVYETAGMKLPTLEKDNQIVDIDPFTVFGLFNKRPMTQPNRLEIIQAVGRVFGVRAPVPASFSGVPVLDARNATFYPFIPERGEGDIDDLWGLFESALAYAAGPGADTQDELSRYFDLAVNKKGNGTGKITMGMYWTAPDAFLTLDRRSTWYIYESGKIPEAVVRTLPKVEGKADAAGYFDILGKVRGYLQGGSSPFKDFKELSLEAWRYSEEVNEALRASRQTRVTSALADSEKRPVHYWVYAPGENACKWEEFYGKGIMAIGWGEIGDLREFANKAEIKASLTEARGPKSSYMNIAHAVWQFVHDMAPGDVIFAKKGMSAIVGRGVVTSDYEYDADAADRYNNLRKVQWTHKAPDGNGWEYPGQAAMKTLTDITDDTELVEKLNEILAVSGPDDELMADEPMAGPGEAAPDPYGRKEFLEKVYMAEADYDILVGLLKRKKNVILQGAPGVGKTFAAKRLAYSIIGSQDQRRVMMVQFHQSYSYEDFIMGLRPSREGAFKFALQPGVFCKFCEEAEKDDSDQPYFFIIDEINRGNLSKIFGELFMLIERDKRGLKLPLLYGDEKKFSVPENVYVIGLMNTADRSLAMVDYALRRRFAFFEMRPGFDTEGFKKYQAALGNAKFDRLIECVKRLNKDISDDDSLGEGFRVGHSYFCGLKPETLGDRELLDIVEYELIPLLKEYWFDSREKVEEWSGKLRGALQ